MSAYIHVRTQIEFGKGARMIEQKFRCVCVYFRSIDEGKSANKNEIF